MTPAEASAPLPAGGFSAWLRDMRAALAGRGGMNVACGDCRGCCTSYYYVKIRADEAASLARIAELAGEHHLEPGPPGDPHSRLLGHQANGHCRMLVNRECTIYAHRPETCRSYDCRVFTAAGMDAGEGKTEINERVARWRFEYPTPRDRAEHAAVMAAADFLRQHPVRFSNGQVPSRPAEIAVLAIKCYEAFLNPPDDHRGIVAGILAAVCGFDHGIRRESDACT
jgi:Fe-S-cluster containining protein